MTIDDTGDFSTAAAQPPSVETMFLGERQRQKQEWMAGKKGKDKLKGFWVWPITERGIGMS